MTLPYTIQIPVYNETRALEFSALYFDRLGLSVRYVLDSQRTDEAETTLRRLGREPVYFLNERPYIENGYENFAALSPTDWILRLDCDEVPSRELIRASIEFVERNGAGIAGFDRHQVLFRDGRLLTATTDRFRPSAQRQWRLFNRQQVRFNRQIHSPGLHLDHAVEQQPDAVIYHLSWVFLSLEERVKKAARYDANGQSPVNRLNQLFPIESTDFADLHAPFLQEIFSTWSIYENPVLI